MNGNTRACASRRRGRAPRGIRSAATAAGAWARVVVVLAVAFLATACERPAGPKTEGGPKHAAGSAHRLVVLSPALAVTLRDLGLASEVVGRHAYDMVLDKSVPVCGDQAGIDYEALLAARPTHVLIQWGARAIPERLTGLAREHGWVILSYPDLLTLEQVRASVDEMGRGLLGPGDDVRRQRLLDRLDRAWSLKENLSGAGRVLMLTGTTPVCTALGPGSFHQRVLERIGGVPALREGSSFMELDAEDVLRLAPDVIVLVMPRNMGTERPAGWDAWDRTLEKLGVLGRLAVPAVEGRRVVVIDDPLALLPGTNLAEFADALRSGLTGVTEKPNGNERGGG